MEPEESNDPLQGIVEVTKIETLNESQEGEVETMIKEESESDLEWRLSESLVEDDEKSDDTEKPLPKKRGRKRRFSDVSQPIEIKRHTQSMNYSETKGRNHSIDALANYKLNEEEAEWLKEQISKSRFTDRFFTCTQCQKILKSYAACRYHLISKHIKTRDSNKNWIAQKVKEGEEFSPEGKVIKYKCTFCSKSYPNAPGLRYHLKSHLNTQDVTDDQNKKA